MVASAQKSNVWIPLHVKKWGKKAKRKGNMKDDQTLLLFDMPSDLVFAQGNMKDNGTLLLYWLLIWLHNYEGSIEIICSK